MSQTNILAIVGSLRSGSVNAATARAAVATAPVDAAVTLYDVSDLPLYNGDEEDNGPPIRATALHDAVAAADGIILFSPEYNGSLPAVTKNVIDWLSRPPTAWAGKAISLVTTTPGGRAGAGVREHFSAIMGRQPTRLFDTLGFGSYGDRLDADGEITHADTVQELADFVARFVAFAAEG